MTQKLCYLSGAEALAGFRRGTLSPVELLEAVIRRTESVNVSINALTETYFDRALDQARESEQRYLKGEARPLDGLPLAVKDEFRVKGTLRSSSSLVYRNRIDTQTDTLIERLLEAGAICHAKTTTPEFCILGSCHSRLWGVTRNPSNLEITPGGSSGGSGAALSAGMTTLATGTDIGGSIRIPASQCGVVGYKAPYGRNPEVPVFNLDFYSHSGPMARTVVDCALMQNIISGPSNRDIATLRDRVVLDTDSVPRDLRGLKIAWSMNLGFMEIDRAVENNTLDALQTFRDLGADVEEVDLGWTEEIIGAVHHYWAHSWVSQFSGLLEEHRKDLTDYAIWFIENSRACTAEDFNRSLKVAVGMYDTFGPMMDRYDLFVCPTLGTNRVPADYSWPDAVVTINGDTRSRIEESWSLTYPFNMLSRCPVMSVPSGVADNNVATGIQLVARTYDDPAVFRIAKAYEQAAPERFVPRLDPVLSQDAGGP
ncbi:MAG: amidase [Gammaproteobacteria bacterium]|nr:amidase [Gammaproteobacteria bacterium]MYD76107.1 amidase [Gammaproteobacteria bacterium]